jgi:hypothetical protein
MGNGYAGIELIDFIQKGLEDKYLPPVLGACAGTIHARKGLPDVPFLRQPPQFLFPLSRLPHCED